MSEIRLVDFSYARPSVATLKAAGVVGVMRYLTHNPAKALTASEAAALRAAGLWLGVVFEDSKTRTSEGRAAGKADALFAAAQALTCGVPTTCPIGFAVDSNYTIPEVLDYFMGVADAKIPNPVMVYGSLRIVEGILGLGLATYGWQTGAWSGGVISPLAHLYQRITPTQPLAGTDEDVLLHPMPLWGAPGGPMPLLYPGATYKPVDSHGGAMGGHMGLVEHITTNDFSPFNFFANPANQASSHLWIAADGSVEQYLSLDLASWAQAGGNGGWTSCEISGQEGTAKTPAQVEALAKLFAWGSNLPNLRWPMRLSDDPNTGGLGWHGMGGGAWGGHVYCPGDARRAQRPAVLARAIQIAAGSPAAPTPIPAAAKDTNMAKRFLMSDGKTQIVADAMFKRKIANTDEVAELIATGFITADPPEPLTTGSKADSLLRRLPWAPAP